MGWQDPYEVQQNPPLGRNDPMQKHAVGFDLLESSLAEKGQGVQVIN